MKRLLEINPNTKTYWNGVYVGEKARADYEVVTHGFNGNSQRLDFALKEVKDGDKVLDIGCGIGMFTEMVKEKYPACEVWGTDISSGAIEENKARGKDIKYFHQYIGEQVQIPDNYFDVVFSGEVLEHIEAPIDLFTDAFRVLKPGGKFIMTTPNRNRILSEEHIWEFDEGDIEQLFSDSGFSMPRLVSLPDTEWYYVLFAVGVKPMKLIYDLGQYDDREYASFEVPQKAVSLFGKFMSGTYSYVGAGKLSGVKSRNTKKFLQEFIVQVKSPSELEEYWKNAQKSQGLYVSGSGSMDLALVYPKEQYIENEMYYQYDTAKTNKAIQNIIDLL